MKRCLKLVSDSRRARRHFRRLVFFGRARDLDAGFERRLGFRFFAGFDRRLGFRFFAGVTRSGSSARPVSLFHSSNVSGEIFPVTRSSANFRRCALLLKGIGVTSPRF
jgi:hypothetical protein